MQNFLLHYKLGKLWYSHSFWWMTGCFFMHNRFTYLKWNHYFRSSVRVFHFWPRGQGAYTECEDNRRVTAPVKPRWSVIGLHILTCFLWKWSGKEELRQYWLLSVVANSVTPLPCSYMSKGADRELPEKTSDKMHTAASETSGCRCDHREQSTEVDFLPSWRPEA